MKRVMESGSNSREKTTKRTVRKEEVIATLKDDGDFDNLRFKIIRKVKHDEELRNRIIAIVRQSAALNRAGAENMKPRQLLDAIYDEVGSKLTTQLSDGVWEIIRSPDGMKNEITETVQSVYNKLVEPGRREETESSTPDTMIVENGTDNKGPVMDDNLSDSELNEPPGFSSSNNHHNNSHEKEEELQLPMLCEGPAEQNEELPSLSKDMLEVNDGDVGVPSGFSADVELKEPCDSSDEDPDVPPGFG